jgi:hypothetical protein
MKINRKDHLFLCLKNPNTEISKPNIKMASAEEPTRIFKPKPMGNNCKNGENIVKHGIVSKANRIILGFV